MSAVFIACRLVVDTGQESPSRHCHGASPPSGRELVGEEMAEAASGTGQRLRLTVVRSSDKELQSRASGQGRALRNSVTDQSAPLSRPVDRHRESAGTRKIEAFNTLKI
jgi:hypothetical protein